jgi:hypothetical protein
MSRVTGRSFMHSHANWGTLSKNRLSELKMVSTNLAVFCNITFTLVVKIQNVSEILAASIFRDYIADFYS